MQYEEYKTASERHLETCLSLKQLIETNSITDFKKKNEILSNIYYLSGYVIECIVNYGILTHIRFDEIEKKQLAVMKKKYPSITPEFSFMNLLQDHNKNKVTYSQQKEPNAKYHLYKTGHKLNGGKYPSLYYFKNECAENSYIDSIHSTLTKQREVKKMFDNWNVEVRYSVSSLLNANSTIINSSDVLAFLSFAELVNFNLSNHIIPKL